MFFIDFYFQLISANSPPVPKFFLMGLQETVASRVSVTPDVAKPYVETIVRQYVPQAVPSIILDPVGRVRQETML